MQRIIDRACVVTTLLLEGLATQATSLGPFGRSSLNRSAIRRASAA
jgi:hypothetical protein